MKIQFVVLMLLCSFSAYAAPVIPIVPQPVEVTVKRGVFVIADETVVTVDSGFANAYVLLDARCWPSPANGGGRTPRYTVTRLPEARSLGRGRPTLHSSETLEIRECNRDGRTTPGRSRCNRDGRTAPGGHAATGTVALLCDGQFDFV
jgi:hypothetical protein